MLVTIVVLFVVTELPQGALALCSGLVDDCFRSYYSPLGDTMDIVALVNNGVNFALYCTMSARFRQTFAGLVWPSGRPCADEAAARRRRRAADDPGGGGGGVLRWRRPRPRRPLRGGASEDGVAVARRPTSDVSAALATWNVTTADPEVARNQLELVEMSVRFD